MATAQECETALHQLAARLAQQDPAERATSFDRTLSCTVRDLGLIFAGRLRDGELIDIAPATGADAQIRLELTSDDLLALVDGTLNVGSAWATKRLKIGAGVRDMLRLRSVF